MYHVLAASTREEEQQAAVGAVESGEGKEDDGEEDVVLGVYHVRKVTKEDVEVKFIRSGGAGGQNVNKVNTKADIRLQLDQAEWIPNEVKKQIKKRVRLRQKKSLFIRRHTS